MIMEGPKTKEDWIAVKKTVLDLIVNPHADIGMIKKLNVRLTEIQSKIDEF